MSASAGAGESASQVAPLPCGYPRRRPARADRRFDPAHKPGRCRFGRQPLCDDAPQRLDPLAFRRQPRIVR
jgi:hypothetical protein